MANIQQAKDSAKKRPETDIASVDSFKLKVPLSEVSVIDLNILSEYALINMQTSEIHGSERDWKKLAIEGGEPESGISTRYRQADWLNGYGVHERYLVILINSKVLKSDYFQGITQNNTKQVYNSLMEQGKVSFTYETFLDATCTDVDFKTDFYFNDTPETFDLYTHWLSKRARQSAVREKGYRRHYEKTNKGIEFSKRETTSFRSAPYLKLYHKGIELNYHSNRFSSRFLNPEDYTNLVRMETTVKNKAHFRAYGIEDTSLKGILSLSQDQIRLFFSNAYDKHFQVYISRILNTSKLKPMERVICRSIEGIMEVKGLTFNEVKSMHLAEEPNRQERHRISKALDRIYEIGLRGTHIDLEAQKFEVFSQAIGLIEKNTDHSQ